MGAIKRKLGKLDYEWKFGIKLYESVVWCISGTWSWQKCHVWNLAESELHVKIGQIVTNPLNDFRNWSNWDESSKCISKLVKFWRIHQMSFRFGQILTNSLNVFRNWSNCDESSKCLSKLVKLWRIL